MKQTKKTGKQTTLRDTVRRDVAVFGNARALCFAAMLAAMSLLLGKFLQIPNPLSQIIRISFENLPILLAGITMGPLAGAMTGVVADILGCVLYGYDINPIITLGAAAVGAISGIAANYILRRPLLSRVVLAVVSAHLCGSVLIKSAGLAAWYLVQFEMGFWELVAWRALTYGIIAAAECAILYFLLRHKAFASMLERIRRKR